MLTGESLEQLHADLVRIARELRESAAIANNTAVGARALRDFHTESFERGRQAGLLATIAPLERALAIAEEGH